ncbi:DUF2628 domain-containing protein [Variovorax sp. YR216]|uniref:DUF2628 domain-containing protein n=1 Tax=Variovorax sp. YR216 TaxID=1882828 RepID=UPI0015A118F8|nr:DUF2628 domain-containing protein [Variovorax sp. YR216]
MNGPTLALCSSCGIGIRREPTVWRGSGPRPSLLGTLDHPRETREGLRELYAAAVGTKNSDHYLAKFALFDHERRTSAGWHWPAFFVTFAWLVHRKMWGKAALYFLLPYVVFVPVVLLGPTMPLAVAIGCFAYLLGIFILPPLLADATYYRHCERVIEHARAVNRSQEGQLVLVAREGGTSGIVPFIVGLVAIAMLAGTVSAVALPAYQDYTARMKAKQVAIAGDPQSAGRVSTAD